MMQSTTTTVTKVVLACFVVICLQYSTIAQKLIRKVAIVGSGTAGLGLAAALKQLPTGVEEVTVFEARGDFMQQSLGGGVQINGGAAVMEKLGLLPELERVAQRMGAVRSRNNFGVELLQLDIFASVLGKAQNELCATNGTGAPMVFSIMRDALQRILYDATQTMKVDTTTTATTTTTAPARADASPRVRVCGSKACVAAIENHTTGTVTLQFADGQQEGDFDVVFGADGVGSSLRQYTSGKDRSLIDPILDVYAKLSGKAAENERQLASATNEPNPHTGLRIMYGVTPEDNDFTLRPGGKGIFHQWLGNGCYALTASYGGVGGCVQHMVALVYRDGREEENQGWNEEDRARGPRAVLLERLRGAKLADNEELLTLVNACDESRFIDLGVRDRTLPLLSWAAESGRIILLGDSAHAMAPFLGQGANQGLQDAWFLAKGIESINQGGGRASGGGGGGSGSGNGSESGDKGTAGVGGGSDIQRSSTALRQLVRSYEWKRKIPTALLGGKARLLGAVETAPGTLGGAARDLFFFVMGKVGVAEFVYLDGARPSPPLR